MLDETRPTAARRPKTTADENFPVASFLIAPKLRPHVLAFYAFARAADDVADAPDLEAAEKLRRLDAFEAGLDGGAGPACAAALRRSLAETGVCDGHARRLLAAFREDARGLERPDWDSLMAYCAKSAHPVGRFLLDLHGERAADAPAAYAASDALCAALQVLNHLQDIRDDHARLNRVYLPSAWLAEAGVAPGALSAPALSAPLRGVVDRALDGCDALLDRAAALPRALGSRRLAGESAGILALARRLARRLRREDPLAGRVVPSRADFAAGALAGLAAALAGGARPGRPAVEPAR